MKMGFRVVGLARVGLFELTHNPKVAGSNPAPATTFPPLSIEVFRGRRFRLQNVSETGADGRGVQQPDCAFHRRGTQVHVPLRRHQIAVSGQLLNGFSRCPPHRQVRTERVPQHVHADMAHFGLTSGSQDEPLDESLRQCRSVLLAKDERAAKMSVMPEGRRETKRHRHVPETAALGDGDMSLPSRPLDTELPLREIHIRPFQRHHLPASEPGLSAEQHNHVCTRVARFCRRHEPFVVVKVVEPHRGL